MKKIVQINSTANWGSTGRIAENIGKLVIEAGWDSTIAFGRNNKASSSNLLRIGNKRDMIFHGIGSRLFDKHGLLSKSATEEFVKQLEKLNPDIIHLHNIHGYYLNFPVLFDFLKHWGGPVVWTLHDCWSFTGHCAFFENLGCEKWEHGCHDCQGLRKYPVSVFSDNSKSNYEKKRKAFLNCPNLTLVPVSDWLGNLIKKSILKEYPVKIIKNGIDISLFRPKSNVKNSRRNILGVASVWEKRKGLEDFKELRALLPKEYQITLVGLTESQIKTLPEGIRGISRTESIEELVTLYSESDLLVNPTYEDTFPTVNLEAIACGTPVLTYRTGGSPETIDEKTGRVVDRGDINGLAAMVRRMCNEERLDTQACRERAERLYDSRETFRRYIELYNTLF